MNQKEIKAPLVAKIEATRARIAASPHTIEESQSACDRLREVLGVGGNVSVVSKEDTLWGTVDLFEAASLSYDIELLIRLEETMSKQLMRCEQAIVLTDAPALICPAGFHPSDRVFVQTTIAIFCDEIPDVLPQTGAVLRAFRTTPVVH